MVTASVAYEITLRFDALKNDAPASLVCGALSVSEPLKAGATEYTFHNVRLPVGPARFEPKILQGKAALGVKYVEIKRLD